MDENAIYDSEVSPKEIIKQMKINIYNNFTSFYNTSINLDYLLYRPSIFSLIHKISNKIGFKSQTFFLSAYYLDILHLKYKKIDLDLKVISLACLLLAAKYAENDQDVPNLPIFVAIFNSMVGYRDFISNKELFFAEVLACKLLEYKLNYFTIYDFDSFFFGHGIIKIEQLKGLNNGIKIINDDFNDINMDITENSVYIRKILEKIYRRSRYYLDMVINNGNICLKYNSLIISVVIMKKSVEDVLLKEQKVKEYYTKEFKEKTAKCFKEIMKEIYQIDYESMEDYQNLISDNELINTFQEKNKRNYNYNQDTNLKFLSNKEKNNNLNVNNRYGKYLNNTLNGNIFIKKLDYSQNIEKFNISKRNGSRIESEENNLYSSKNKQQRISVPKKYNLNKNYNYLANFNSSFTSELNISKKINLTRHRQQSQKNKVQDISLKKRPEIDTLNTLGIYMNTYTNKFYDKKRKETNSINKNLINVMKNININESYEDAKKLINIIDNNKSYENDNQVLNIEAAPKNTRIENYEKMVLKKRFFNRINRPTDISISRLNESGNVQNIDTFIDKHSSQNIPKPYFKKVIKNVTNHITKTNSKTNSFYATVNNNMYNPNRRNYHILNACNPLISIEKEKNDIPLDNELNIEKLNNRNKQKVTLEVIKNFNNGNILSNSNIYKSNHLFNPQKKKISNNILLNSMAIENSNKNKKEEKDEIFLTTNNDIINQNKERQKLLFMRMRNINKKINFQNTFNKTEIQKNEIENIISKRKFLISNNIGDENILSLKENSENNNKDKMYENQILNISVNNKRKVNKNVISNIIKELKPKNIKNKFVENKNSEKNISEKYKLIKKEIKKEKIDFPKSSIFKLINRTKTFNADKLDLPKEELNSELMSKFPKNLKNLNQSRRNNIIKNMQTLDFDDRENDINESKNIQNLMFNTIENDNFQKDKKDKNIEDIKDHTKNIPMHSYHYRNYMKSKIKKEKETDGNKSKNKNNENSKTIVINNNININFNNKIEHSNIYQSNKNENINKQINYNNRGTIENANIDNKNGYNNNIPSGLHRIPFYKKNSGNNINFYSRGNSKETKVDN